MYELEVSEIKNEINKIMENKYEDFERRLKEIQEESDRCDQVLNNNINEVDTSSFCAGIIAGITFLLVPFAALFYVKGLIIFWGYLF